LSSVAVRAAPGRRLAAAMTPPMTAELASKLRRSSDDDVADMFVLRGGNASFGFAGPRHTVSFVRHFQFDPCVWSNDHGARVCLAPAFLISI
jgi:hypothetical protein